MTHIHPFTPSHSLVAEVALYGTTAQLRPHTIQALLTLTQCQRDFGVQYLAQGHFEL